MGQQQLLIVILVTIIIGIASVVAINTFATAHDQSNLTAVQNDIGAIATSAQGYYNKPELLGGGNRSFSGISFRDIAFPFNAVSADFAIAQTENGRYVIEVEGGDGSFTITAHPASSSVYEPGQVDASQSPAVLSGGTDAAEADRFIAVVCPNDFVIAGQGEGAPSCP